MDNLLLWIGRFAGLVGAVLSLGGMATRLSGHFWLVGVPASSVMLGGMALMLVACVAYLAVLAGRARPPL